MPLPLSSGFNGRLGRVLDGILAELRGQRPVPGVGTLSGGNSLGSSRSAAGSNANGGNLSLLHGAVQAVYPNHLGVMLDSGENVLVKKPWSLCVGDYVAYDGGVIGSFMAGGGFPGYSSLAYYDWFTLDYLMQTAGKVDSLSGISVSGVPYMDGSFSGGAQSRFRLVYAPFRDTYSPFTPKRGIFLEFTWPPYYPHDAIGGRFTGQTSIYVAKLGADYLDLNLEGRHWVSETQVSGEGTVLCPAGGGIGQNTDVAPQRV